MRRYIGIRRENAVQVSFEIPFNIAGKSNREEVLAEYRAAGAECVWSLYPDEFWDNGNVGMLKQYGKSEAYWG